MAIKYFISQQHSTEVMVVDISIYELLIADLSPLTRSQSETMDELI